MVQSGLCSKYHERVSVQGMLLREVGQIAEAEAFIDGVLIKNLKTHADNRGFFREIIRENDPFFSARFAQWSHSKMTQNTVKAWHYHHKQYDWWYLGLGIIETVLFDAREESKTYKNKLEFKLGDSQEDQDALEVVIRIPTGVLHGCKVISETAHLFYITSEVYDPQDEGRLPFNSHEVPHSWGPPEKLIVAERDKVAFTPPHPREA